MTWSWAALMPHPPIIVPEVGKGREQEASITLNGVQRLMECLQKNKPDRILVLSPHQPYALGAFAINRSKAIRGSLAPFGAASVVFDLRTPLVAVDSLSTHLQTRDIPIGFNEAHDLTHDQGSIVPLYFLESAYEGLPSVVLSSPIGLDRPMALRLGRKLASYEDGSTWGLVASGDLSHRLTPDAPAGFSPAGEQFDKAVVESLQRNDASPLMELSPRTVEEAGECGMRSVLAMLGLVGELSGKIDVLSYEGPFGVGYCNAIWMKE